MKWVLRWKTNLEVRRRPDRILYGVKGVKESFILLRFAEGF